MSIHTFKRALMASVAVGMSVQAAALAAPQLLFGNQQIVGLTKAEAVGPLVPTTLNSPAGRFIFGMTTDTSGNTWWSGYIENVGGIIGTLNPANGNAISSVITTHLYTGIAWNGSTLYAMADTAGVDTLGTVNTTTGEFTPIGAQQFIDDIAFVGSTLYGVSRNQGLVTIDTSNGAVTDLFAGDELNDDRGMAYVDGTMYLSKTGLRSIDLSTGTITDIGTNAELGNLQGGLAQVVPEPVSLGLMGLGGIAMLRRRRSGN